MRRRLQAAVAVLPSITYLRPASALRQTLKEGYSGRDLRADVLAGFVVGVIALPLSMALAIASGVPPQHGLYTAIVAGAVVAVLGGSRVQVTGPTAAFVVILAPIAHQYGLQGLAIATVMAGVILMAMGFFRFGRLIQFIPYPVTTGFTAGIATVIATFQLKDFLGLRLVEMAHAPESYLEKVHQLVLSLRNVSWPDLWIGILTLAILILWSRYIKKVPAALVALTVAAGLAYVLHRVMGEGFTVETIQSKFGGTSPPYGIPRQAPIPVWPWSEWGGGGVGSPPAKVNLDLIQKLIPAAFAIAMLGAIESLLSAVVADGMSGQKHDPDAELLAQGTGNVIAPFFGGIAATGAIARTAANIRSGARSPVASIVHAVFVLVAVLALAPLLGYLPMASMAALLMMVAWNMSEAKHFVHTVRVAPPADVFVLLTCFGLTVIFDMTIAVSAGVVLAAMLFMRRMAEFSGAKLIGEHHPVLGEDLPRGLLVYEIAGPLFFGAAEKAMSELRHLRRDVRVVVFDLTSVPVMDATGLVSLETAVDRLYTGGVLVIIAGVQEQPAGVLKRAEWSKGEGRIAVFRSFNQGLATARAMMQLLDLDPKETLAPAAPEAAPAPESRA